jgi:putative nucleotidyltransferase with HDIG domain
MMVTFATVALLLIVVFAVVMLNMREQVRQTALENLGASQRVLAAFDAHRQRELVAATLTLAENPTLRTAADVHALEESGDPDARASLLARIQRELDKVAAHVDLDAVVVVDAENTTLAAAGPLAGHWLQGRSVSWVTTGSAAVNFDGVASIGGHVFRIVAVPLVLVDAEVGALLVATSLDQRHAESLEQLSGAPIAIVRNGVVIASTLPQGSVAAFEAAVENGAPLDGTVSLRGEPHAFRRLLQVGDATFYALQSIVASARVATRDTMQNLMLIGLGAAVLSFVGSFWLARTLSEPIGRLSEELAGMKASRGVHRRLPLTGSSLEIDTLIETFNGLLASVAQAEAQTEAAYMGAIRALATALDARDAYTAGHSERVSLFSLAIARQLDLVPNELEVIRLGALLHDIGKIGVPDEILTKPGRLTPEEYEAVKRHPGLGAKILSSVPFLAPHIPIVELHHERPDGRGYPHGLKSDDIPLSARVVHVADAYDAMTTARAYRDAMSPADAVRELRRCSETEYHTEIVSALVTALPNLTVQSVKATIVDLHAMSA